MKTHSDRIVLWMSSLIVGIGLLPALCFADTLAAKAGGRPALDEYKAVLDVAQNMFLKNRSPQKPAPDPNTSVDLSKPESFYVLRGIANENGTFVVFLQDRRQDVTLVKRVGENVVADGRIKSVLSLDGIEYQTGEITKTIRIGCDLEGNKSSLGSENPGLRTRDFRTPKSRLKR